MMRFFFQEKNSSIFARRRQQLPNPTFTRGLSNHLSILSSQHFRNYGSTSSRYNGIEMPKQNRNTRSNICQRGASRSLHNYNSTFGQKPQFEISCYGKQRLFPFAKIPFSTTPDENPASIITNMPISMIPSQEELVSQTEKLLDLDLNPIGSFTSDTMDQSVKLLESWARIINPRRSSTAQTSTPSSSSFSSPSPMSSTIASSSSTNPTMAVEQMAKVIYRIIQENKSGNPESYFNFAMAETVCYHYRETYPPSESPYKILEIAKHVHDILDENTMPYNNLIAILTKIHSREAAMAVEGLLKKLVQLQSQNLIPKDTADLVTHNSAISSWLHIAGKEKQAGERAVAILNRFKGAYRMGNSVIMPSILSFRMVIDALLRSEGDNAALEAENIVQDLIYFHGHGNDSALSWTDEDMMELNRIFDTVLVALNRRSSKESYAADRALKLLQYMETMQTQGLLPSSKTYALVIGAFAKQRNGRYHAKIKSIMDSMRRNYDSGRNASARVETKTYNALITAYAKQNNEKAAETTLREMIKEFENGNDHVKPNTMSWNLVLECHAKSNNNQSSHNISRILEEMIRYSEKYPDVQPDKVSISSVLKALGGKASNFREGGKSDAGNQAVNILESMIRTYESGNEFMKPDKYIFSAVINCIAKSGSRDAGNDALTVLNRMQRMHETGDADLKPDTVTINSALSALANSQSVDTAIKAEQLLKAMINSKDPQMAPNVQSYTLAISAWAKSRSKETTEKVEQLLLEMDKVAAAKPNVVSYSTALNAFAKSEDPNSYERSMRVLNRMEDGTIQVRPNAYCYASVMECIANSPDRSVICHRARELLRSLSDRCASGKLGNEDYTVVFNIAIKAIEKSDENLKHQVVSEYMCLMKEFNKSKNARAPLNVRAYNAAIRSCAFTKGDEETKRDAFNAALGLLKELRASRNIKPDLYTYPAIFRASEELLKKLSEEDLESLRSIFQMCCEDGLVDGLLLKNMINYLSEDFLRSLFGTEKKVRSVKLNDLPQSWRMNIYKKNTHTGRKGGQRKSR